MYMKAIQITIDESLLEELDRHPLVRANGRSAVLRQAAREFIARSEAAEITARYKAGYADHSGVSAEFSGWAEQASWPEE